MLWFVKLWRCTYDCYRLVLFLRVWKLAFYGLTITWWKKPDCVLLFFFLLCAVIAGAGVDMIFHGPCCPVSFFSFVSYLVQWLLGQVQTWYSRALVVLCPTSLFVSYLVQWLLGQVKTGHSRAVVVLCPSSLLFLTLCSGCWGRCRLDIPRPLYMCPSLLFLTLCSGCCSRFRLDLPGPLLSSVLLLFCFLPCAMVAGAGVDLTFQGPCCPVSFFSFVSCLVQWLLGQV